MIRVEKDGAEVAEKLAEIKRLKDSDAVRVAAKMAQVTSILDTELRSLRKAEREGLTLISNGLTLEKLDAIIQNFAWGDLHDD